VIGIDSLKDNIRVFLPGLEDSCKFFDFSGKNVIALSVIHVEYLLVDYLPIDASLISDV
jgi:hypothetical protein